MAKLEGIEMQESLEKCKCFWEKKFKNAVETKLGRGVHILNESDIGQELKEFVDELAFKVNGSSPEPVVKQYCVANITYKEFYNLGSVDELVSAIKVEKDIASTKHHFRINNIDEMSFGDEENLCAQIVSIGKTGIEMKVGEKTAEVDRIFNKDSSAAYSQKKKLIVPSKKKVVATMTTSMKEFHQNYTLKFKMQKSRSISVTYLTKHQQRCKKFLPKCYCCCCAKPSKGEIYANEILKSLPDFDDTDNEYCYFTVEGTLTWSKEEYTINIDHSAA